MPALPPVPGVIKVRFIGSDANDNQVGSGNFYRYSGSAPTAAQLATFNTTIGTSWATNMAPITPTDYTLTLLDTVDLSTNASAQAETTVSHPGTRTGQTLPLNVAFSVQLPTNLRRRGGHWRVQLRAGVQTDLANAQQWGSVSLAALLAGYQNWVNAVQTAGWTGSGTLTLVGVQYYGPPNRTVTSSTGRVRTVSTLLTTPVVWPVLPTLVAHNRLGSARRRLGKPA